MRRRSRIWICSLHFEIASVVKGKVGNIFWTILFGLFNESVWEMLLRHFNESVWEMLLKRHAACRYKPRENGKLKHYCCHTSMLCIDLSIYINKNTSQDLGLPTNNEIVTRSHISSGVSSCSKHEDLDHHLVRTTRFESSILFETHEYFRTQTRLHQQSCNFPCMITSFNWTASKCDNKSPSLLRHTLRGRREWQNWSWCE